MKRTIFLLAVIMSLATIPYRAYCSPAPTGEVLCMVISHHDGTVSKFALNEQPKVTYEGNQLVVVSETAEMTADLSDIAQWTFEMSDISGISETEATPQALIGLGRAEISGLAPNTVAAIYSLDGKALSHVEADSTGHVSIDLGHLSNGVYILRTPHQSYKFIIRK